MRLAPPELSIKIKNEILPIFGRYLMDCAVSGFTGINNYINVNKIREEFLIFHLKCLIDKISEKVHINGLQPPSKNVTVKFNHGERITLSNLFRRVQVPAILTDIEFKVIDKLTLIM